LIAQIAVENTLYAFDMLFSYEIPVGLESAVIRGVRVVVPFGRGNRKRIGVVFGVGSELPSGKIKPIDFVIDSEPVLSGELMDLCVWIRENTFCTYYDAFRAILPPGLGFSLKSGFKLAEEFSGELTDKERGLLRLLKNADKNAFSALISGNSAIVKSLAEKGAIVEENVAKRRIGDESVTMLRLLAPEGLDKPTAKQRAVIGFLEAAEAASLHEVCYECAVTPAVVKRLVEKNVVERYENVVFRTESGVDATESPESIVFSPKQQEIFDGLLTLMRCGEPRCALLRGVTGSGKTSVFIRLINEALKRGQSAIMLVPEISLTPQTVARFRGRFGDAVAVMHSRMSQGERYDQWDFIRSGAARVVVGARSALFTPLANVGLIVIDEEHEGSYKQDSAPRYAAGEVAAWMMERAGADAVVAEGMESGGHIGAATTMTLVPQVVDAVSIPVIAAGGIADGRGFAAARMLGAEAVQIGTRFLVARECTVHENYKKKVIAAKDIDSEVTGRSNGHPVRQIRNKLTREYLQMEKDGASFEEMEKLTLGSLRKAVVEGDVVAGTIMAGQNAGMGKKEQTYGEIVQEIISEAEALLNS